MQFLPVNSVVATAPAMAIRFLLQHYLFDSERDRRIIEPDRHVDFVGIEPLTRNCSADIGFAPRDSQFSLFEIRSR